MNERDENKLVPISRHEIDQPDKGPSKITNLGQGISPVTRAIPEPKKEPAPKITPTDEIKYTPSFNTLAEAFLKETPDEPKKAISQRISKRPISSLSISDAEQTTHKETEALEGRVVIQGMTFPEMLVGLLADPENLDTEKNQARLTLLDALISGDLWKISTVQDLIERANTIITIKDVSSNHRAHIATLTAFIDKNGYFADIPIESLGNYDWLKQNKYNELLVALHDLGSLVDRFNVSVKNKTGYYTAHMFILPQFKCGKIEVPIEEALAFCNAHLGVIPFFSDEERQAHEKLLQTIGNASRVEQLATICSPIPTLEKNRTSSARRPLPAHLQPADIHSLETAAYASDTHDYAWLASHPNRETLAQLYDLYRDAFTQKNMVLPVLGQISPQIDVTAWVPTASSAHIERIAAHTATASGDTDLRRITVERMLDEFKKSVQEVISFYHTDHIGLILESWHAYLLEQNGSGIEKDSLDQNHVLSKHISWLKNTFAWRPQFEFGIHKGFDFKFANVSRNPEDMDSTLGFGLSTEDYQESGCSPMYTLDELMNMLIHLENFYHNSSLPGDTSFVYKFWQLQQKNTSQPNELPSELLLQWLQANQYIVQGNTGQWFLSPTAPRYISLDKVGEILELQSSQLPDFLKIFHPLRPIPLYVDYNSAQIEALKRWSTTATSHGNKPSWHTAAELFCRFGLLAPTKLLIPDGITQDTLISKQPIQMLDGIEVRQIIEVPVGFTAGAWEDRLTEVLRHLKSVGHLQTMTHRIDWYNPESVRKELRSLVEYELTEPLIRRIVELSSTANKNSSSDSSRETEDRLHEEIKALKEKRKYLLQSFPDYSKFNSWHKYYSEVEKFAGSDAFKEACNFCRLHTRSRNVAEHDKAVYGSIIRNSIVSTLIHISATTLDSDITETLKPEEVELYAIGLGNQQKEAVATVRSRAIIKIQEQLTALDALLSPEQNRFTENYKLDVPELPNIFMEVQEILSEVEKAVREWEDAGIKLKNEPSDPGLLDDFEFSTFVDEPEFKDDTVTAAIPAESFDDIEHGSVLTKEQIKELRQGYEQKKNDDVADTLYHIKRIMSEQGMQAKNPSTKDISGLLREIAEQRGIQVRKASLLSRLKASLKKIWKTGKNN